MQNDIFNEIIERIKKEDISAHYFWNGYFYYRRYESGKEYTIYCRKKGSLENTEQILIDERQKIKQSRIDFRNSLTKEQKAKKLRESNIKDETNLLFD